MPEPSTDAETAAAAAERVPLLAGKARTERYCPRGVVVAAVVSTVLLTGVVACMWLEGWGAFTSLYVIVQIATTIGFGDVTPTTDGMRLFFALYALASLVVLAYFLNLVMQYAIAWEVQVLQGFLRGEHKRDLRDLEPTDEPPREGGGSKAHLVNASLMFAAVVLFGALFYWRLEPCMCPAGADCDPRSHKLHCVEAGGVAKSMITSFYMSVMAVTTIGFGDIVPKTPLGRGIAILWLLVGTAAAAHWITAFSAWFFETSRRTHYEVNDLVEQINAQTFKRIDHDGNGSLSRGEFMAFTLLKYGVVTEELLADIDKAFDQLDVGGNNRVTFDMLQDRESRLRRNPRSLKRPRSMP